MNSYKFCFLFRKRLRTDEEILSVLFGNELDIDEEEEEQIKFSDHDSNSEQEWDKENNEQSSDNDDESSNFFTGKDKVTKWSTTEVCSKFAKTKATNLVKRFPTPKACAQDLTSELTALQKIIDETILLEVVKCSSIFLQKKKRSEMQYQRDRD